MKVVINEKIYVQVRDILFIARLYNNERIMAYYVFLINNGYRDSDFVKSNNFLLNKILQSSAIVDFRDYQNYSDYSISNLIINLAANANLDKEFVEHQISDLRDIISFRNGELDYTIPLIPDEKIDVQFDDLHLSFKSTIFSSNYIIESMTGEDIDLYDYKEALNRGIESLKERGMYNSENIPSYQIIKKDTYVVVCFQEEKKKNKLFDAISMKLKKGQNKTSQ